MLHPLTLVVNSSMFCQWLANRKCHMLYFPTHCILLRYSLSKTSHLGAFWQNDRQQKFEENHFSRFLSPLSNRTQNQVTIQKIERLGAEILAPFAPITWSNVDILCVEHLACFLMFSACSFQAAKAHYQN